MRPGLLGMAVILTASTALSSCASGASPPTTAASTMSLHVANETSIEVTLRVNDRVIGIFGAGGAEERPIDVASLPPLPWSVVATSPSGRPLTTMIVTVEDATQSDPNVHRIPMGRVDLSCGRLTIWAGEFPPSGSVRQTPAGSPGDCA
jgi:hypothetical protein